MTRKRVKLSYIVNHTLRRITFKKRKVCVAKKLDELTTLCGIEACAVIYSEFDAQPYVWPSMNEVRRLVTKYRSFSKVDQGKRKVNQEIFTKQRLEKMEEKLKKLAIENRHNEMTHLMFQCMVDPKRAMARLNRDDLKKLARVTNETLMDVKRLMEIHQRGSSLNPPPPPPPQFVAGGSGVGGSQHLVGFGSSMAPRPNMTYPLPPIMEYPAPNMEFQLADMGFQPHDMNFQPENMMFQPVNMDFQHANMGFQPPNMDFHPDNMGFPAQNDMPYMDPNMGMPDPNNLPPFPYYHNPNMGPHDPSSH